MKDYLNIPSMIGDGKGKTDLEEYNGKDACSYGKYDQPKGIKQIIQSFSDYEWIIFNIYEYLGTREQGRHQR